MKIRGNVVGTNMKPEKIADRIGGGGGGVEIDDDNISANKTWSSEKIANTFDDVVTEIEGEYLNYEDFRNEFYSELEYAITTTEEGGGLRETLVNTVIEALPVYNGEVV